MPIITITMVPERQQNSLILSGDDQLLDYAGDNA